MYLYRFLLFFGLFFLVSLHGYAQDTLVVQGVISTTTTSSVDSVKVAIIYYDSATVLKRDTIRTNSSGFYSDTLISSRTNKIIVGMETCRNTNDFYTKNLSISSWTNLKVQTVSFTNFCFSAAFNYLMNGSSVAFTSALIGGVSPYQYNWDFGDGNNGSVANPNHNYNTGGPAYQVSLTVTDSLGDSVVVSKQINTRNCISDFGWIDNGGLNVSFLDSSFTRTSGSYFWDFGDGNNSTLSNPNHTYTAIGSFIVCLTVTDTNSFCSDTYCDSIFIDTSNCKAAFSFLINQNIVTFTNQSTSNNPVMNYSWGFDDGGFSSDFSPSHIYFSNGNYKVGLVINDSSCADTVFHNVLITSINTGSLIIAGNILINGKIDDAEISLISNISGEYKIIDQMSGLDGKYSFNINPNSTYYLKARPSAQLPEYFQILPAYYMNTSFWQDATAVVISNESSTNNDFDLVLTPISTGTSSIAGTVGTFQGTDQNIPFKGADVYLFDDLGNFITRDESDANGTYSLSNLSMGNYFIHVDVMGHTSAQSYRSISQNGSSIEDVDFTIYPDYILDIKEETQALFDFKVYPNPAHNTLNIEGNFNENLEWKIFSMDGRHHPCELKKSPTKKGLEINIEKLPIGYYLIELKDKESIKTLPFLKIN